MNLLIKKDTTISIILPVIIGKSIKSYDTSANKAIKGFAAAGGCTIFKYIITETQIPTEKPNDIKEIPISSLTKIPIIIEIKCPKKIFFGWANSLSWKTKIIKAEEPKEKTSHTPKGASKVINASKLITKPAENPLIIGSSFFDIFMFIFSVITLYITMHYIKSND